MKPNQRLFNRYSENFKRILSLNHLGLTRNGEKIEETYYLCPISLELFLETALFTGSLTIEHVPPRSLGGKPIILTSKTINSTDGYSSDKNLLNFFESLNFKSGKGGISTVISSESLDLNGVKVVLSLGDVRGKLGMKMLTSTSNIEALDYKGLFRNWNGGQFNIRGSLQNQIEKKTLLKCAYLTAFASIGYSLIMCKDGLREHTYGVLIDYLRGINPENEFPCVYFNQHAPIENSKVGVVSWNENVKSFVVNLTFKLNEVHYNYAVFLPHPETENLDCLKDLAQRQLIKDKTQIDFKVTPIHGRL